MLRLFNVRCSQNIYQNPRRQNYKANGRFHRYRQGAGNYIHQNANTSGLSLVPLQLRGLLV